MAKQHKSLLAVSNRGDVTLLRSYSKDLQTVSWYPFQMKEMLGVIQPRCESTAPERARQLKSNVYPTWFHLVKRQICFSFMLRSVWGRGWSPNPQCFWWTWIKDCLEKHRFKSAKMLGQKMRGYLQRKNKIEIKSEKVKHISNICFLFHM